MLLLSSHLMFEQAAGWTFYLLQIEENPENPRISNVLTALDFLQSPEVPGHNINLLYLPLPLSIGPAGSELCSAAASV